MVYYSYVAYLIIMGMEIGYLDTCREIEQYYIVISSA